MIIDAHCHFFSKNRGDDINMPKGLDRSKSLSCEDGKKFWIESMDKNEIEKAVFIATSCGDKECLKFVNSSDRFIGISSVNPIEENAVEKLDEDIKAGCKGLKLYATTGGFNVADEKAEKVYEYCEKKKLPIIIHFGVSTGKNANLNNGNPINLSSVVAKFHDNVFVIPHFGAGYFKEALMVMYKNENVYFDTSGTNNWLDMSPFGWSLSDVFKCALKAVGSERIIFGTDTHKLEEGYRLKILNKQKKIVSGLVGKKEMENIFYNNAKRVYGL